MDNYIKIGEMVMNKILIFSLCIAMSLLAANSTMASTITLGNYSGVPQFAGTYVGPVGGTLDGNTAIGGGIACLDIASTSYFGSTIGVTINTLEPLYLTNARYGSDATAIFKYEEAAWLLGQIPSNATPAQVGNIQFAIWRIFNNDYVNKHYTFSSSDLASQNSWLALAAAINPMLYDFSSVYIYTPTSNYASNQEFMSGVAAPAFYPVPVPSTILLMGSGLVGLALLRRKWSLKK
jgi:hypothetical protein